MPFHTISSTGGFLGRLWSVLDFDDVLEKTGEFLTSNRQ
jgi:hypothetical protein